MEVHKILLLCGIIGTPLFFLFLVIFSFLYPGYNPVYQTISELGGVNSPVKTLSNVFTFNLFGVFIILFSIGVFISKELNVVAKIASIFFFITGIMMFLTGIFPTDANVQVPSETGSLHNIFSNYQFPVLALGLILFALAIIPHPKMRFLMPVILILGLVTLFVAYKFFFSEQILEQRGVLQRIAIGIPYLIVMMIALSLYITEYKIKSPLKTWFIAFIFIIIIVLAGFVQYKITNKTEQQLKTQNLLDGIRLGPLCKGEKECFSFCQDNKGRCTLYCNDNPKNEICLKIFSQSNEQIQQEKKDEPIKEEIKESSIKNREEKPVLKNLGINIETLNKQTNLAGDLIFTKKLFFDDGRVSNDKVFIEFGNPEKYRSSSENIEIWFFMPLKTKVIAPIGGIAKIVFFNHTNDWGINIVNENSEWIVSFEHIVNLKIKEGDFIKAGDIVGEAAPRITFNNEISMVELVVWKGGKSIVKYCPTLFLDDSLKQIYAQKIKQIAKEWEEFIGKDVYKEESWIAPGCLKESITEKM